MDIYICNFKNANNLKEVFFKLKNVKRKIIILSFCKGTAYFLTRYYYNILRICKYFSLKNNNKIILCFYLKKQIGKYLNALYITCGKVNYVFGESFSLKRIIVIHNKKRILFLFYYDIYNLSIFKNIKMNNISYYIGLDNETDVSFNRYIKNKFNKKIILIEKNSNLVFAKEKNILKKDENIIKLNIQKIT